jgi:hypothetical protein
MLVLFRSTLKIASLKRRKCFLEKKRKEKKITYGSETNMDFL